MERGGNPRKRPHAVEEELLGLPLGHISIKVSRDSRKCFELKIKNVKYPNWLDEAKAIFRGKFIALENVRKKTIKISNP